MGHSLPPDALFQIKQFDFFFIFIFLKSEPIHFSVLVVFVCVHN